MSKVAIGKPSRRPHSAAIMTANLVFVSGQVALDPDTGGVIGTDVASQMRQVVANLTTVLAAAELTLADIVKTTVFLVDMKDFEAMNDAYQEHFPKPFPARSTIGNVSLARPQLLIEIEAIADRDKS